MSLATLENFLLWCTVINYVLLIVWWVILKLPHGWIYRLSTKGLTVSEEMFDRYNLAGIIFYKMAIILFNFVPWIALHFLRPS